MVEKSVLTPDLLSWVGHLSVIVSKLVEDKEMATHRCTELEKQLAEMWRRRGELSQLKEEECTTLNILREAFGALADPLGSLGLGVIKPKDGRTAQAWA